MSSDVRPRLVVISGLSGAGKSHVARAFEDIGWSVIDNLPLPLFEPLVDHLADTPRAGRRPNRTAVVVDTRLQNFAEEFPAVFERLRGRVRASLVFVEADDDVLIRRYSETRRPHPLGGSPTEGVEREIRSLRDVRALADSIVDTSHFNVHELRSRVIRDFGAEGEAPAMAITVQSFGFKHGLPPGADMVFDVRFLPNPHFVPELRALTGNDPAVQAWLEERKETEEMFIRLRGFVSDLIPRFAAEHKSYLTIAIGCTGGRHRSVYLATRLGEALAGGEFPVRVQHRDAAVA